MRIAKFGRLSGSAALLLAAACNSNPTAPAALSNPLATTAAVAALDSTFLTSALASFGTVSTTLGHTAATAPLGRAGAIVQATLPRPGEFGPTASAAAVKRLSGLRAVALAPTSPQGPVINDTLYGSIYTWDTTFQAYLRTATTGGPANGIRFILYAINPFTGSIAVPLNPVGQADLLDESVGLSAKLHIIVTGNGGTPSYLDYTAGLTVTQSSLEATLTGSLTNALPGAANKVLTFNAIGNFTLSSITAQATYALNNPAVTLQLNATDVVLATADSVTLVFAMTRQGETIGFTGLLKTTNGSVDTVTADIKVNNQPYASVKGDAAGVTFYDHTGAEIVDTTQQHDILVALEGVQFAVVLVISFTSALFGPIVNLLSS